MESYARDKVLKLIEEKVKLENELREQQEILNKNGIDMVASLVDDQGYPRDDIAVYEVRHARHNIICLQNDLRRIFKQIEDGLINIHAEDATNNPAGHTPAVNSLNSVDHADNVPATPFAIVTMVENGSPADVAGLCKNDKIIQFGSLTHSNFTCMEQIYKIVSHSVGQRINVQVMRGNRLVVGATLIPKPCLNRGLLGCHIQKIDK